MKISTMIRFGALALALTACGAAEEEVSFDVDPTVTEVAMVDEKADTLTLRFDSLAKEAAFPVIGPKRELFTSASAFRNYFKTEAKGVDFSKEYVAYFTMGTMPTGGYEAKILGVRMDRGTMIITTQTRSPGPTCLVTKAFTTPTTFAIFKKPSTLTRVRYQQNNVINNCN